MCHWKGDVRLIKDIKKPSGLKISVSDWAYLACSQYIENTPPERVEKYRKIITIERRYGDTYVFSVYFEISAELSALIKGQPYPAASFIAYAMTEFTKSLDSLSEDQRRTRFMELEAHISQRKKDAPEQCIQQPTLQTAEDV